MFQCRHVANCTTHVWLSTESILPGTISVVFNAWSVGDVHYVVLVTPCLSQVAPGYSSIILGFSPLGDEYLQDAAEYTSFAKFVLSALGKSISNGSRLRGTAVTLKNISWHSGFHCQGVQVVAAMSLFPKFLIAISIL